MDALKTLLLRARNVVVDHCTVFPTVYVDGGTSLEETIKFPQRSTSED